MTYTLDDAVAAGDLKGVREQLAAGADPDVLRTALSLDDNFNNCMYGRIDFVAFRHMVEHEADEGIGYELVEIMKEPLARRDRAKENQHAIVSELLGAGADPNELHAAIANRTSLAVIQDLVQAGANLEDVNGHPSTPLLRAVQTGYHEAARVFIDAGADVHAQGAENRTALYWADNETTKALITAGADVNSRDAQGITPLINAAQQANGSQRVRLLIEAGADVHSADLEGVQALHLAAVCGHIDTAKLLIEAGADINATDAHGFTPLHTASQESKADVVHALVQAGADVNAKNLGGDTPLHSLLYEDRVSEEDNIEVARALVQTGADPTIKNNDGKSPIDLAAEKSTLSMVALLTSAAREQHAHEVAPPARERSRERSRS